MPTPNGYSNQKMRGPARHQTVQTMGSDRVGVPTAQMYLYERTPAGIEILTAAVLDSDSRIVVVEFDGPHNAAKFDVMRMQDGVLEAWEFEIIKIINSTTVHVYNIGDVEGVEQLPQPADGVKTLRWTTALSDKEGALQTSSGPVQFVRDSATTTVNEDTVDPTENRPLPAGMYILKEGIAYPVQDSATPSEVVAVPVKIMAVDGTNINITAGDINVQLTDMGASFDATRIGDGSGIYLKVNGDGSLNVKDADALAQLALLVAKDFSTSAKQDDQITQATNTNTKLDTLNAKDFATSAKQDTGNTSLGSIDTKLSSQATSVKQDTMITALGLVSKESKQDTMITNQNTIIANQLAEEALLGPVTEAAPATDTASSGINGRLQRISQRISSLINLFPASLGQKTMANSFAVTVASDQIAFPIVQSPQVASYQEILSITTAAQTFIAPANARWCKIMADETNAGNVRVKIGGVASATSGFQFQPGRSEDFNSVGNISVFAESGANNKIYVQFGE